MKKIIKRIALGFTLITTVTAFTPTISVFAYENTTNGVTSSEKENAFQDVTPTKEQLQEIGLTEEEINEYLNSQDTGITLKNGLAYDKDGNILLVEQNPLQRGRLTWAVNAIRRGYNRLPNSVKNLIGTYTGLQTLLGFIDHFTGAVEDAIYWACKQVGMPDWAAWTVTKGLTLLL